MSIKPSIKQSYESYFVHGDFSKVMANDETIVSYETAAEDVDGIDSKSIVLEPASEYIGVDDDFAKLYVRVRAGEEAKSPYKITIKIVTSTDNKWEVDGPLQIKEI